MSAPIDIGSLLGGIGSVVGAGASVYGATQADGGGGGGGGAGSFNPASAFLELIFGVAPDVHEDGSVSLKPISQRRRDRLMQAGIFGEEELAAIEDFLTPLPLSEMETGTVNNLVAQTLAGLNQLNTRYSDLVLPTAEELVRTGFLTDVGPVRDLALRNFQRETIPGLREQFAGQVGTFGTDFLNSIANAGSDLETELGALQVELQEAASSRRATGIPLYANLLNTQATLPLALGGDIFNLGTLMRQAQEGTRPGSRVLNVYSGLSGLGAPSNTGAFYQGFLPSGTASTLASLSQGIPQFAAALGGLYDTFNQDNDDSGGGVWV